MKRTTTPSRGAVVILRAWADTPLDAILLVVRDNGRFEKTTSSTIKSFEAGTWTIASNTLQLLFIDSRPRDVKVERFVVDQKTSTLSLKTARPATAETGLGLRITYVNQKMKSLLHDEAGQ